MPERFPRPLSEREAAVLDYLLSVDFPGRAALAEQRQHVQVTARWESEPTIELAVLDRDLIDRAVVQIDNPVEANTRDGLFSVVLRVRDGRLGMIELVDNAGQGQPEELPAPEDLAEPFALGATAAKSWRTQP
jgi:hypothetical protein